MVRYSELMVQRGNGAHRTVVSLIIREKYVCSSRENLTNVIRKYGCTTKIPEYRYFSNVKVLLKFPGQP